MVPYMMLQCIIAIRASNIKFRMIDRKGDLIMELRHLRYFVRVAEELHFGRAAAQLGISQPPLSQQVRALEQELGVALFERSSRRVQLTEPGKLFLAEARRVLQQAEHAIDVARRAAHGEIGELAIGFVTSVPFVEAVATALFRFRGAHPAIRLDLRELPLDMQISALAERQLDVGFIRGMDRPLLPPGLTATKLLEEELIVALRSDHPLAAKRSLRVTDLADQPFVLYDNKLGAGFNEQLRALCREMGFEPHVIQEAAGLATLLGLVSAGFGITCLSRSLSSVHLDSLTYRPLEGTEATTALWLVSHDTPSLASRHFQDIVIPKLSAESAEPVSPVVSPRRRSAEELARGGVRAPPPAG